MIDDTRGSLGDAVAMVVLIALSVGALSGAFWLLQAGGIMDYPDTECTDVEVDDEKTVDTIVLYADETPKFFGSEVKEGAVVVYSDGSYDVTGPLDIPDGANRTHSTDGVDLFTVGDEYVRIDQHDNVIAVGPDDPNSGGLDTRTEYEIYETCEVGVSEA